MDAFITRKRPRKAINPVHDAENNSTDLKLAILASLHPEVEQGILLEAILAADGSVEDASSLLKDQIPYLDQNQRKRLKSSVLGQQSSLSAFSITSNIPLQKKSLTKRGRTLHLYDPKDIEEHTPCSIIHNFLPSEQADALLRELLPEAPTFGRQRFKLFDRVVESPHSACFYVDSYDEARIQKTEYVYNGSRLEDVRNSLPEMKKTALIVKQAVNEEIQRRIKDRYPKGEKLKYQSPDEWHPNCSFVNCYDGAKENVGYHTDQLTYLGPRAIIGSISLGVAREFRVRQIVAQDDDDSTNESQTKSGGNGTKSDKADAQGQISIHLPHNSLLVMHAEMQEEWKHSITAAQVIDPHPIAGNKRINITYRWYRDYLHPKFTPKCKCGIACVLRCVQRKKDNRGKYMWSCHTHYTPGQDGCSFFQWAEFDEDGRPPWAQKVQKDEAG